MMSKRTQFALLTTNGMLVIAPLLVSMGYAIANGLEWENFGLFLAMMSGLVPMVYRLEEASRVAVFLLVTAFIAAVFLLNAIALNAIALRRSNPALMWTALALLLASYAGAGLQFLIAFHPG